MRWCSVWLTHFPWDNWWLNKHTKISASNRSVTCVLTLTSFKEFKKRNEPPLSRLWNRCRECGDRIKLGNSGIHMSFWLFIWSSYWTHTTQRSLTALTWLKHNLKLQCSRFLVANFAHESFAKLVGTSQTLSMRHLLLMCHCQNKVNVHLQNLWNSFVQLIIWPKITSTCAQLANKNRMQPNHCLSARLPGFWLWQWKDSIFLEEK